MYTNVSEKFNSTILGDNRNFKVKITSEGVPDITSGIFSIVIESASVPSDSFTIGGAYSTSATIKMVDPGYDVTGKIINIFIGLEYEDDEQIEYVPCGKFKVTKPENDDGIIEFTAYDAIEYALSEPWKSSLTYPAPANSVLAEIATKTGVMIDVSEFSTHPMIPKRKMTVETDDDSETESVIYVNPFDGYTNRDALGFIALFYNRFAVCDRNGIIKLKTYTETNISQVVSVIRGDTLVIQEGEVTYDGEKLDISGVDYTYNDGVLELRKTGIYTVYADKYYDDLVTGEVSIPIDGISCSTIEGTLYAGEYPPNMAVENPVFNMALLDNLIANVPKMSYTPVSFTFFGDVRLDVGDIIAIKDKYGNVYSVPVMALTLDFDGGVINSIQSFGNLLTDGNDSSGRLSDSIERTEGEILKIKELYATKARIEQLSADQAFIERVFANDINVTGTLYGAKIISETGTASKDKVMVMPDGIYCGNERTVGSKIEKTGIQMDSSGNTTIFSNGTSAPLVVMQGDNVTNPTKYTSVSPDTIVQANGTTKYSTLNPGSMELVGNGNKIAIDTPDETGVTVGNVAMTQRTLVNKNGVTVINDGAGTSTGITSDSVVSNNISAKEFKENGTKLSSKYVPQTRKVNGKALSSDITLGASDVGALSANSGGDVKGVIKAYMEGHPSDTTPRPLIVSANSSSNQNVARINSISGSKIEVNGQFGSSGYSSLNVTLSSSDKRLKENIAPSEVDALAYLRQIKTKQFDWKDGSGHWDVGVIADELKRIDPRLTIGGGNDDDGNPNYMSVDNWYLTGYLLKAIQELDAKNKALEDRLMKLETILFEKGDDLK